MRELATQKLSQAYRLDEIAASVATMQSASALDSVASLVLQRAPNNHDARYVHFFHEKIPSRMMAESTSLDPLNDIIAYEHGHSAPLRTRALTRIFKDDHIGAVQDLTEALSLCKIEQSRQTEGKNQLMSALQARQEIENRRQWSRDWMQDRRISDEDQPRSMEMQLLFQRGNQYLTLACQDIKIILEAFRRVEKTHASTSPVQSIYQNPSEALVCMTSTEQELFRRGLEARESLRKYAKRALRDHTTFLAQLDYALVTLHQASTESLDPETIRRLLIEQGSPHGDVKDNAMPSHALTRRGDVRAGSQAPMHEQPQPKFDVYLISDLLSDSPPSGLPSLYHDRTDEKTGFGNDPAFKDSQSSYHEMITYHPLMLECLHSILLAHALLQSPPTSIHRIATNVARIARLADGYPFFLSARSPARADWSEILRKTHNWIKLPASWDTLCRVDDDLDRTSRGKSNGSSRAKKPQANGSASDQALVPRDSNTDHKDKIRHEAMIDALGDERVVDDETFAKAVAAREERAWQDLGSPAQTMASKTDNTPPSEPATPSSEVATPTSTENGEEEWSLVKHLTHSRENGEPFGRGLPASKGPVAKDEEYMIGTERAEAIAQWVLDAPAVVGHLDGSRPKRKKKSSRKRADANGLETSVDSLHIADPD